MHRLDAARLANLAYNAPEKLADERAQALADAGPPPPDVEVSLDYGRALERRIEEGKVLD